MRTRIKICGITTRDALLACIDAGVDAVGFVLAPSPRRIEPDAARSLIDTLPPFITSIGVFQGRPHHAMRLAARRAGASVIQADAADLLPGAWNAPTLPVYRTNADLSPAVHNPSPLILVEGPFSGAGLPADWDAAASVARLRPIVLAGGLNPSTVADAIRRVRPFAVDVSSGVESAPGVKDPRLILAFAHAVRLADQSLLGEP